ncbi:hypothetical protein Tco_1163704 [Tanacetum coccineum]
MRKSLKINNRINEVINDLKMRDVTPVHCKVRKLQESWSLDLRLSDCPELKNQNHENQSGGTGARGMVHALGGGEINQDLNNMEDDINA